MDTLNEQLRAALASAMDEGWSVNQIADEAKVAQVVLNRFVRGDRDNVRLDTADKLAAWLGMRFTKPRVPRPGPKSQPQKRPGGLGDQSDDAG